jgi:hypothetical protein
VTTNPGLEYLTSRELAELLRIEEQTIRVHRVRGTGPSFVRIGNRVLYRRVDVERWLADRTFQSTAEAEGAR